MKNLNSFFTKDVKFSLNEEVIIDCAEVKGVIKEISVDSNSESWYLVIYPYGSIWVAEDYDSNCGDTERDNAWVCESGLRKIPVQESWNRKIYNIIEKQVMIWENQTT